MGVVRWELSVLVYGIKGGIGYVVRWVCMDLVVMEDDVEFIDSEDWSEEEEVSFDGGKYVGDSKLCRHVFFESWRIRFAIPDGIVIKGYIVAGDVWDSFWVCEWNELDGYCKLMVVRLLVHALN